MYCLVGMVFDNFRLKKDFWRNFIYDFYGCELKNIDLIILIKKIFIFKRKFWWFFMEYDFEKYKNIFDIEWLKIYDFLDFSKMFLVIEFKIGKEYYVLFFFF